MKTRKKLAAKAVSYFGTRYNCAESMLLATTEVLGSRSSAIPRVATGFGAGIGRRGSLCGALTGAIMAVGLAHGRSRPTQDRERAYSEALKIFNKFVSRFGSPECRKLTGCDLTTQAGRKKFDRLNIHAERCDKYVKACAEMVADTLSVRGRTASRGSRKPKRKAARTGRGKTRSRRK